QVVQAWQWPYSAFGDEQPALVVDKFAGGVMPLGTPSFNLRYPGQYADSESGLNYNYFRNYNPTTGRYSQSDPIGLDGGWNRFGYVHGNPLLYTDPLGLMGGGSPQGRARGAPNVNSFGCMGLACITGGMEPTSMSAELSFGGGIEICDPPSPPPPEPPVCSRYNKNVQVQPPGVPVPEGGASRLTMRGGLFFGPSFKKDGRFCLRLGPHFSVPGAPSIDLGETPL
ncbi:MAG: RHS repeat-associated core domain-containing protein, partial [Alphaproteobacteria bacterium]